jgi:death-on-curing protein
MRTPPFSNCLLNSLAVEFLTEDEVLVLYQRFIGPLALRDPGGLSSAVNRPKQSAFGEDAYPTIFLKAAALMQSLAQNQSFVDGNKRIAWFAGKAFLGLNGFRLRAGAEVGNELFRARIAKGMTVPELASWVESHSRAT